ncbi:MAG: hypothetical protein H7330_14755 [Hymenobacteraceae bacterium]|nr:hypothetical protein [Hymenobacteraceae bacterium]
MFNFATVLVANEEDLIQKENVSSLRFSPIDVLSHSDDRRIRTRNIERACTLGNAYHGKVLIHFITADGNGHRVDTTIWASDDRYITLKAGASLPVRAITGIEFI